MHYYLYGGKDLLFLHSDVQLNPVYGEWRVIVTHVISELQLDIQKG